jgi:hypothetical protein
MEPTLSAEDEVSSGYLYFPGKGNIELENDSQSRRGQFATPINCQMSQTPRMSQSSPLQGPIAQTPQMPMMGNQPIKMTPQTAHMLQQQRMQAAIRQRDQAREKASSYGWEHIVVAKDGLQRMTEDIEKEEISPQWLRKKVRPIHSGAGTPNNNLFSKWSSSWDTTPSRLFPSHQLQIGEEHADFLPGPSPGITFEPRNMRDIFPGRSTTQFPPSPPLDPLDYQHAKAVDLGRSRNRLRIKDIATVTRLAGTATTAIAIGFQQPHSAQERYEGSYERERERQLQQERERRMQEEEAYRKRARLPYQRPRSAEYWLQKPEN